MSALELPLRWLEFCGTQNNNFIFMSLWHNSIVHCGYLLGILCLLILYEWTDSPRGKKKKTWVFMKEEFNSNSKKSCGYIAWHKTCIYNKYFPSGNSCLWKRKQSSGCLLGEETNIAKFPMYRTAMFQIYL